MIKELAPALIGLLGVLVGGFVSAYATKRAEVRERTLVAARLAQEGLGRWAAAITYMQRAPERLADKKDDYDLYLAVEVHSLAEQLDDTWWREHGGRLAGAATKEQWQNLIAASKATVGLLRMIASIGDAGREALHRRLELQRAGSGTRKEAAPGTGVSSDEPARHSLGIAAPSITEPVGKPNGTDLEPDETDALLAEADQKIQDFDQSSKKFKAEMDASMAEIRVLLDYRLFLVRDVVETFVSARQDQYGGSNV